MSTQQPLIAGFGEIMMRLSPPGKLRFTQALPGALDAIFGGGEANVCASLAMLGLPARFLSALPANPITRSLAAQLRGFGCDVSHLTFAKEGRLGIYFAEAGSNMRPSAVVYDREGSSIALLPPEAYDFEAMLGGVTHLHLTGITPALSRNAFLTTLALAKAADEKGITISIDLNFRKKLWNWEEGTDRKALAQRCMEQIVPLASIIIGNEEDAADVFGIAPRGTSVESGALNIAGYEAVAAELSAKFPKAKFVAITLRQSISADHNNWGGMLYCCKCKRAFFAPLANGESGDYKPYEIRNIVDRIGGGDSFSAGLIYALTTGLEPKDAIRFAVAASALKHTIPGDYNFSTREEVIALMKGSTSGRVQR